MGMLTSKIVLVLAAADGDFQYDTEDDDENDDDNLLDYDAIVGPDYDK